MRLNAWFRAKKLHLFFFWLSLALLVLGALLAYLLCPVSGYDSAYGGFYVIMASALLIASVIASHGLYKCYVNDLAWLKKHLGVDDLQVYVNLSASQMEDLCLKRLAVLGHAMEKAQQNHPMPVAKERLRAEDAFKSAYWFFEGHKCIHPTPWARFFSQTEIKR